MKPTTRLLLTLAAPLLTAAPAPAWHHCRTAAPMMPMMPMGMPMMGMGMMPTMPMMGLGVMPMSTVGAGGMSMSMTMSGDMTLAMLAPAFLRNLVGTFLGVPGAAGMTEAQVQALGRRIVADLLASDAAPMTKAQGQQMTTQLQRAIDLLERALSDKGIFLPQPKADKKSEGPGSTTSPELERARAEVRRLAAAGAARPNTRVTAADLERARAEVRRLAAAGVARPSVTAPAAPTDLERARAEVRRLAAESAARPVGQKRPSGAAVASGAK